MTRLHKATVFHADAPAARMGTGLQRVSDDDYYDDFIPEHHPGTDDQPKDAPHSQQCSVSLVLLMDESGSIARDDWKLQLSATADALMHQEVQEAIQVAGGIAITARLFDGSSRTIIPWHTIRTPEDAKLFADTLRTFSYQNRGGTNIGDAVKKSMEMFASTPCKASHKVIDISTDGVSAAEEMEAQKKEAEKTGVTIHGIAVHGDGIAAQDAFKRLQDHLVTYDGMSWVANWENYAMVIRRKLVQEMSDASQKQPKTIELAPLQLLQIQKAESVSCIQDTDQSHSCAEVVATMPKATGRAL